MRLFDALETFCHHNFNEDNLNEQDYYGMPLSEQLYTHGSCYISLFKHRSFDQSDPPEAPQILDIYSVLVQ